jgi:spermidine synthase
MTSTNITNALSVGRSGARTAVLGAFFVSGACGLIHEVAWTRLLRLIMGNTTFSITTVLCAFMGGLALGSYLGGRLIDRRRDPLRVFAILEGSIGIYCFLLPWLTNGAEPLYRFLYQNTHTSFYVFSLIRFVFSGVILLIPATFMGATLPVLTRFLTRSPSAIGKSVGTLYAINTFGAVLGAFISGFVLIPALGVTHTIYLASMFNLLVSITGFWLYRKTRYLSEGELAPEKPLASLAGRTKDKRLKKAKIVGPAHKQSIQYGRGALIGLLWGYGLSGFAALVYEIAWTRVLSLLIGSTVYAFSLMLTAFVVGIAVGSIVYARFVDQVRDPMRALAIIQIGIGGSALMVVPFIDQLPFFVTGVIARYVGSFWALQMAEFTFCLGMMLIPTTLMGAAFPLASRLYNQQSSSVGRTVGDVYGANTIGNILGAFLGGFVLIPFVGIQNTILVAVSANILVSFVFLILTQSLSQMTKWLIIACIALITGACINVVPGWDPGRMSFGPYHTALHLSPESDFSRVALEKLETSTRVLFHEEGLSTTVTVKEIDKKALALYVNGKPDASTHTDLPHQELVAHIPLMFHPRPRSALVIGLASGISVGSVGRYPLEKIDCVEISPAIVEACRYFEEYNYHILDDSRVEIIVNDGRNHLLLTDRSYDVIMSQPSNPYLAGVADLFTQEYFELCRDRLNDGGVMCTWMQSYRMDLDTFQSIVKTFHSIFPDMSLWRSGKTDCLLIGTKGTHTMNYNIFKQRLAFKGIADDLKRIDIHNGPEFLAYLVMGGKGVKGFSDSAGIHTDDNALVEFSAPRFMGRTIFQLPLLEAIEEHRETNLDFLKIQGEDPTILEEMAQDRKTAERFIAARSQVFWAYIFYNSNQGQKASAALKKAAELNPSDTMLKEFNDADRHRAFKLAQAGQMEQAVSLYRTMVERVPGDEKAHYNLALALKLMGNLNEALCHYKEAAHLKADYVIAVYNVGEVSQQLGDLDTALLEYQRALALKPDLIPALNSLARLRAASPNPDHRDSKEAVRLAEAASQLTENRDPYMLETLAVAYESAGRYEKTRITLQKALGLSRNVQDGKLAQRLRERLQTVPSN